MSLLLLSPERLPSPTTQDLSSNWIQGSTHSGACAGFWLCVLCGWTKKIAKAEAGGMSHHDKPPYTPRGWHSELQPVILDEAIKRAEAAGRDAAVARAKRENRQQVQSRDFRSPEWQTKDTGAPPRQSQGQRQ